MSGFDCSRCSEHHAELPRSFAFALPDFVHQMHPADREERCQISDDWCIVDNEYFYVRGCIEIPIQGSDEVFVFGVWSTLSEDNFDRTMELWSTEGRESEPPYFGWLGNTIPFYDETRNLKLNVRTRKVGERPYLEVQGDEHQLAREQRNGMTRERAIEIAELVMHGTKYGNPV